MMEDINERQKEIAAMREWLNKQPQLPQGLEDRFLLRFLHSCYYDLDKTKTCMDLFFTIRSTLPDILNKRDPTSKEMVKYMKIVNMACISISGKRNLWLWQLNDPGLETYDYTQDARLFYLSGDAWILENNTLQESDIVLMDVKDISLKMITKFNMSLARKLSKYQQDAMPTRLKQIHIVNAPPFIDKLYALLKPLMKQEFSELIHFHKPNSETLYNYLNKEDLPNDYGGNAGTMDDLMQGTIDLMMRQREFLIKDNFWTLQNSKKSKDNKHNNEDAASTCFRSLDID